MKTKDKIIKIAENLAAMSQSDSTDREIKKVLVAYATQIHLLMSRMEVERDALNDTLSINDKKTILSNLFGYNLDNKGDVYRSDFPFPKQINNKLDNLKDIFNYHAEQMKKEGRQDFKTDVKNLFV